jgi:glutamine amidotransferase-like uncharacterized protein
MTRSNHTTTPPLRIMIYRGANSTDQCPESVARLFKRTFPKVAITYAGPSEKVQINADSLSRVDVFAQPGGPDVDDAMEEANAYAPALRSFVENGGRYVGFCLGAYMAGHDPGFGLIPAGDEVAQEIEEPGAQVGGEEDTIIQVDWSFSTGKKEGKTERERWLYFQDGPVFSLAQGSTARVLARYSRTGGVAAVINGFGKGWVANVGPHPEADRAWCKTSLSCLVLYVYQDIANRTSQTTTRI